MAKFTFICEDEPMPFSEGVVTKRTIEFDAVALNDIVSEFELFLRGAGFNPPGILDFVPEDDYYGTGPEWTTEEWDTPQEDAELHEWTRIHRADAQAEGADFHSKHYFDTERNK
jgi:hypothetical protein